MEPYAVTPQSWERTPRNACVASDLGNVVSGKDGSLACNPTIPAIDNAALVALLQKNRSPAATAAGYQTTLLPASESLALSFDGKTFFSAALK